MPRLFPVLSFTCALALSGTVAGAQSAVIVRAAADSFVALSQSQVSRGPWPDLTDATRQSGATRVDWIAAQLAAVRRSELSNTTDQLLFDNLSEVIDAQKATRVCRNHLWTGTSTFSGWHITASNSARTQPVGSDSARARALRSFARIPEAIRDERALLQRGLDSGYTASQDVIAAVVRQLDDLLTNDVEKSPLYEPARRDSSPEFRRQWIAQLTDVIYPAARNYRTFLSMQYLPRARPEGSMSRQRDGVACYAASLRAQTSVRADVDSMMREARREYDVIAAQLTPLVAALTGARELGDGIAMLRSDPRFTFSSRDSILPAYRAMTALAASRIGRVVAGFAPESIVVAPYPAFQENAGLPPQYQRASNDGSRPAQFMVNLSRTERMSVADAVAHEAYPGHHLQRIAENRAELAHPAMRSLFIGGFIEGWGIYSETLGDEMGLYSTPLLRAGYLVHLLDVTMGYYLDIGYHVKGWTRKDLVDSMVVLGGRPVRMAEAYADRHAATPGQLATYYAGYRAIRAGRQDAEARLGSRFRMPEFHREVLRHGTITLASLRRQIDAWIAAELKGSA
ncbi:MAG: DUF885 domain-containing protein [Gemmatimonadota bacterium]